MARGYNSYRGRRPRWKLFLAVLLVLIILAAAGFLVMQRFIIYDDMGVPQIALPGMERPQSNPSENDTILDLTIEENRPQMELSTLRAVQLGTESATWSDTLTNSGLSAFCVTVKAPGGQLCYPFAVGAAGQIRADDAAAAEEVLSPLLSGERHSIARISCLRDGAVARANVETMSLKNTGGFVFYDGNNENWLDPGKDDARAYLTDLICEAAERGFDEILLTDVSYPTEGKLDKIACTYQIPGMSEENGRQENLASFLRQVREALPEGVSLSLELDADTICTGRNDAAGQVLSDLALLVDRIYAVAEEADVPALTAAVTAASAQCAFVAELADVPTESVENWMLLPS